MLLNRTLVAAIYLMYLLSQAPLLLPDQRMGANTLFGQKVEAFGSWHGRALFDTATHSMPDRIN